MAGQQLSSVNVNLTASTAQYVQALKKAQQTSKTELDKIKGSFNNFSKAITPVTAGMTAYGAAVAIAANHSRELYKELSSGASIAGTSIQQFQQMGIAVDSVGVSTEQLGSILGDTEEKIGDFLATGGGGFQDFADVMGLTEEQAREVAKELQNLSGRDVLVEMVRQMESAGVSSEKMNFALEGMASGSRLLIPLLKDGGKELSNLETSASNTSTVIDTKLYKSLNDAATQTKLLTDNSANFLTNISEPLINFYTEAARLANEWFVEQSKLSALLKLDDQLLKSQIAGLKTQEDAIALRKELNDQINETYKQEAAIEEQLSIADSSNKQFHRNRIKEVKDRRDLLLNSIGQVQAAVLSLPPESALLPTEPQSTADQESADANKPTYQEDPYGTAGLIESEAKKTEEIEALKTQYLIDAEAVRHQIRLNSAETYAQQLEIEYQREIENLDKRLEGTEAYEQKKAAIEEKYRQEKQRLDELQMQQELNSITGNIDIIGEAFGKQFNLAKNFSLAQSLVAAPSAILKAWESAPFPANVPAVAATTLETAALIAQIRSVNFSGQAHNGMTEIPENMDNQSFLLKAGERVLAPSQNRDLTKFLKDESEGRGRSGGDTIINAPVNLAHGSIVDEKMFSQMLIKQRDVVKAAVAKVDRERPSKRGR